MVLHAIICSAWYMDGYFGPLIAIDIVEFVEEIFLVVSPFLALDGWIQLVVPST